MEVNGGFSGGSWKFSVVEIGADSIQEL
jgi:hypothetical protein